MGTCYREQTFEKTSTTAEKLQFGHPAPAPTSVKEAIDPNKPSRNLRYDTFRVIVQ